MAKETDQQRFERVLRWMTEDLAVASAVYRTRRGLIRVHSGLGTTPQGEVVLRSYKRPRDLDDWLLNSGAALIACCYMDALGKVLRRGRKPQKSENLRRLRTFATKHMPDLAAECRRKGGRFSIKTLYNTYRCGFVHQFAGKAAQWARRGGTAPYWFQRRGAPAINVDRLARGVIDGIADFRAKYPTNPRNGKFPYRSFAKWLGV